MPRMVLELDADDYRIVQAEIALRQVECRIMPEGESCLAGAMIGEIVRDLQDYRMRWEAEHGDTREDTIEGPVAKVTARMGIEDQEALQALMDAAELAESLAEDLSWREEATELHSLLEGVLKKTWVLMEEDEG